MMVKILISNKSSKRNTKLYYDTYYEHLYYLIWDITLQRIIKVQIISFIDISKENNNVLGIEIEEI